MSKKQTSRIPPTYQGDLEKWIIEFTHFVNQELMKIYGILNDLEARIEALE